MQNYGNGEGVTRMAEGGMLMVEKTLPLPQSLKKQIILCMLRTIFTHGKNMRTNIVINEELIARALSISGLPTKKAVVEEALKLLVQIKNQQKIKALRGKLVWTGNLDKMRTDK